MKRFALLLSVVAVAACSESGPLDPQFDTTAPSTNVVSDSSGTIFFTAESGCMYYAPDDGYECLIGIQGADPAHTHSLTIAGFWAYEYECVHVKNGRPDKNGVHTHLETVRDIRHFTGSATYEGGAFIDGPPTSIYNPCVNNNNAYSVMRIVSGPAPNGWQLFVLDVDDNNNRARREFIGPLP